MKGLRKQKPRAVNPNPRICLAPITNTVNTNIKIDIVEPFNVVTKQEEIVPTNENQEEKKSTKTQTTHKTSKWNK